VDWTNNFPGKDRRQGRNKPPSHLSGNPTNQALEAESVLNCLPRAVFVVGQIGCNGEVNRCPYGAWLANPAFMGG
jgi:hypothetical protein